MADVTKWRVVRYTEDKNPRNRMAVRSDGEPPRVVAREYGPFDDRDTAETVALRAIEKHVRDVVVVIPPKS